MSDSSQFIPEKSWTDRIWKSLVENSSFQISSIIVGPFYIGKCPICLNIPIWQIVCGSTGLVSSSKILTCRISDLQ